MDNQTLLEEINKLIARDELMIWIRETPQVSHVLSSEDLESASMNGSSIQISLSETVWESLFLNCLTRMASSGSSESTVRCRQSHGSSRSTKVATSSLKASSSCVNVKSIGQTFLVFPVAWRRKGRSGGSLTYPLGKPRPRVAIMFRWISDVPAAMVEEMELRKLRCIRPSRGACFEPGSNWP